MPEESTIKRPARSYDCVQDYLVSLGYTYSEVASCYVKPGSCSIFAEDIARHSTPSEIERWLNRASTL